MISAFSSHLLLLIFGIRVILAAGDGHLRVITIVEKFGDDSPWEFHSKSARRALVSKKTWEQYKKYKEQTCRLELEEDPESKAKDYLNWEEMAFHKSLRMKLLPNLMTSTDGLSFDDAVMLSKVDNRLLSPEPESLCKVGLADESEQNKMAEKDRFEDTLISRIFAVPNFDEDYDDSSPEQYYAN